MKKLDKFISLIAWISGVFVSLVVGYALLNGPLTLPEIFGGYWVSDIVGMIIIVTTILSVVLSFFRK